MHANNGRKWKEKQLKEPMIEMSCNINPLFGRQKQVGHLFECPNKRQLLRLQPNSLYSVMGPIKEKNTNMV